MSKLKFPHRDVSTVLQRLRDFLLGRKHTLHLRFPQAVAPRTIPPVDLPRNLDNKYSEQYYYTRSAMDSVKPPVVAPIALGSKSNVSSCSGKPSVSFESAPTPGPSWWWDGHCYYECTPDVPKPATKPTAPCTVEPHCEQNPRK
ncbi:uncharacterized protein LOC106714722 [Papilio machaon]|uniref:uncharacterized protein LOC106714722 n=1 Tax=Papilio machaon TaxID=76193 RepID=UPI0006EB2371|nr:uncharacterized protein LOC106714722 [Papilio machaon]